MTKWIFKISITANALLLFFFAPAYADVQSQAVTSALSTNDIKKTFQGGLLNLPSVEAKIKAKVDLSAQIIIEDHLISARPFILKKVIIEDTAPCNPKIFLPLYQGYIGKQLTNENVKTILLSIKKYYNKAGYFLMMPDVPKPNFINGVLRIRMVKGKITKINVKADDPKVEALLHKYAEKIKNMPNPNRQILEYYNTLLNDYPGLQVYVVLTPIASSQPGNFELSLIGKQKRFIPLFNANNNGTRYFGRSLYYGRVTLPSLLQAGDALNVVGGTSSEPKRLQYGQLSYEFPLNMSGDRLNVYTIGSRTNPGFVLEPFKQVTTAYTAGLTLKHPIFLDIYNKWYAYGTVEGVNTRISLLSQPFVKQDYRSLRLGSTYVWGDPTRAQNQLRLEASQGINTGDTQQKLLNPSFFYPLGDLSYTKINFYAASREVLTQHFSSNIALTAQYGFEPLVQNEKFSFGGTEFGLAYDPGEFLGDTGAAAIFELDYNQLLSYRYLNLVQYFSYYDFGVVSNRDPALLGKQTAASAGAGVRISFTNTISGSLELDKPLTHNLDTAVIAGESPKPWRTFFSLQYIPERYK